MNKESAMTLDLLCWLILLISMFLGPVWITKLAVVVLAICHMLTIVMIFKLGEKHEQGIGFTNPPLFNVRDLFKATSKPNTRWDN